MTSNVGSTEIQRLGSRPDVGVGAIRDAALEALKAHFRPEFLNRVDEIVVFKPLGREEVGRIVGIQLGRLQKLLAERHVAIELTDGAREAIADAGYDPAFGARPLKRALQRMVQDPLATKLLQGEFKAGDRIVVDEGPDGSITFTRKAGAPKAESTVH